MVTIPNPVHVSENKPLYNGLLVCGLAIFGIMLIIALNAFGTKFKIGDTEFDVGITLLEFATLWIAMSFKIVSANSTAGAYLYGKALKELQSGPQFAPFGLIQIRNESRLVNEFQCPGEPENVFKGHDEEALPAGKVRPIRVITRAPNTTEKGILDNQMTLTVSFVVQYAVTDILEFIANFGSTEQVEKQVRDIGEIMIAEIASDTTPAGFIKDLKKNNATMLESMQERLNHFGVTIISVRMISPDVSHDVSSALAGIPIKRAEAEQKVTTAEADKTVATKAGEGAASAKLAMLNAEAEGRKKMMDELKVSGEAVLTAETAATLAKNAGTMVIGAEGGMRDLMGAVVAAQSVLKPKPEPKSDPEQKPTESTKPATPRKGKVS